MTAVPMCCPRCGALWHVGIGCRNPNCPDLAPLDPVADRVIEAFRQLTPEETTAHQEVYRKLSRLCPRPELTVEELRREATRLGYVVIPKEVASTWLKAAAYHSTTPDCDSASNLHTAEGALVSALASALKED